LEVQLLRPPSLVRRAAIVAAVMVSALAASPVPADAAPAGPTQLNAADITLLNGVRLAGLWEMPAGQMAAQKGTSAQLRQVGQEIADQHVELDELTVRAANQIGATIPATPTAEQSGWLKEMENAEGIQFDQIFVDRLRAAHGKIFPVIGAVRASTRNPMVRKLADEATVFVMTHMQLLETTGLVRYERLPPAALPPAQDTSGWGVAQANADLAPPVNPVVLWALLGCMVALGALATIRLIRGRRLADDPRARLIRD
jgi:predicted outer membrane protein